MPARAWVRRGADVSSVDGSLDGSRLRQARGGVRRGSQAGGRLAKPRQASGTRQARPASLARGAWQAPLPGFAIERVAGDAGETCKGSAAISGCMRAASVGAEPSLRRVWGTLGVC